MSDAATAKSPVLRLRGVTRRFGAVTAIEGIDLDLYPGETLGLMGDNGAGKSTLIKVLSGFHEPSEGTLTFDGRTVSLDSPRAARELGIETVYQDLGLVDDLSIARNFFLGREPRRLGGLLIDERRMNAIAGRALSEAGVRVRDPRAAMRNLSGGERQAVAIGRAWHFGSRVLILDEPTSALSVQETRKVFSYMDQARKKGMAVVFITHNLSHALQACDRLFVMHHGRAVGTFPPSIGRERLENLITEGPEAPA
jgi:simple sugar transport system ATP-binding protein